MKDMKAYYKIIGLIYIVLFIMVFRVFSNDTAITTISRLGQREHSGPDVKWTAGFLITSKFGTTIVTDPYNVREDVAADIVTVSHGHFDHVDYLFFKRMMHSKISLYNIEDFKLKDISVKSIAAAHSTKIINHKAPDNVIYIFKVDGLQLAHMGDIGQEKLTDQQLKELKNIDVIFIPFVNRAQSGLEIRKSLKVVDQINPKIIIPTHLDKEGYSELTKIYKQVEYHISNWKIGKTDFDTLSGDCKAVILVTESGSMVEEWRKEF